MNRNRLAWARPGHENEYVLNVLGFGFSAGPTEDSFIPAELSDQVASNLGSGYDVSNRGTRIEIRVPRDLWVDRDRAVVTPGTHEFVHQAVEAALGPTSLEVNELAPLPAQTCIHKGCSETGTMHELLAHIKATHLKKTAA